MIHLTPPECVADFARFGPLHEALREIAYLADATLVLGESGEAGPPVDTTDVWHRLSIGQQGSAGGVVAHVPGAPDTQSALASGAIRSLLEHATGRELAIADFADQLCVCYEELNMTYALLQTMATRVDEQEIAVVLVDQAAETLNCQRVSLLILDESGDYLRVLASKGLPDEARNAVIPVKSSVAGKVLQEGATICIEDMCCRPDLAELSQGSYETSVFAAIRVPLRAQGRPVGVLTATERNDHDDFTARDCKLLEGLSSMGAASLMHCRLQRTIQEQMMSTIRALALAVDAKDHYTHAHSDRVARYCMAAARKMGITDNDVLRQIELSGVLHDIGKIAIPDAILSKATKLTSAEYNDVVKTHVRIGFEIVGSVNGLDEVAAAILHHHERYDGLGYPDGLRGDDIPLASRLVAVADTFDAMTSDRPYRKALSVQTALDELKKCRGAQFDSDVVAAFAAAHRETSTTSGADVDKAVELIPAL